MKLIDKKGKLFGLINIIDLAVLLIFLVLIVGGYKRMKTKPIVTSETTEAIITYEVSEVRQPTVDSVIIGEPLYHYDKGTYIGEIVDMEVKPYTDALEYEGKWINAEVPGKYTIDIKVKADVNNNQDVIVVGGEQTRVGIQYRVKNKQVAFFGTVLDIDLGK